MALVAGKVPVVAGTGTNNTSHSIARTSLAKELGADAALVVTPYYNKPNPKVCSLIFAPWRNRGVACGALQRSGAYGLNMTPDLVLAAAKEIPG